MALLPMAMYGLEVMPGDVAILAHAGIPAAFRVTMAAIDPSAEPEGDEDEIARPRATLKVMRFSPGDEDDFDEDSEDEMSVDEDLIDGLEVDDDDSEESEDEDITGGPSDPAKSKHAKREAARKEIEKLLANEGMDVDEDGDDEDMPNGVNGIVKSSKALGKMPASDEDSDEDSDLEDAIGGEIDEFVICTLDPDKHYQQTLDITFGERERVWFKVSGTHAIYLTGNYVEPIDNTGPFDPDSDEEEDYDLSPDEDELDESEDESIDGLDDLADPRITEIEDEEDSVPSLVKVKKVEGVPVPKKNKRPAPESADEDEAEAGAEGLDEMIAKEAAAAQTVTNGDQKLSKKQLKKLKKNNGLAAAAPVVEKTQEIQVNKDAGQPSLVKSDKKVTFANQLEQGPTLTKAEKPAEKNDKSKSSLGVKIVQGVKIDDRKVGTGQDAKKGDRVSMRYIGKLEKDNKQFDSNKSGKPFSFKLGSGEVIKGWDIGVEGMKAGSERRLTIPAHLAYGSKRAGEIPPNSTLIFDIKLLDINKGK